MSKLTPIVRHLTRAALSVATIAAIPFVVDELPSARAQPVTPFVTMVRFDFVTGNDDLRAGSQAFGRLAVLDVTGREHVVPFELNRGQLWPNFEVRSIQVPLPPNLAVTHLRWFDVAFTSGSSGPFDTGDNWNLQAVYATASLSNGQSPEVFRAIGDPLHRFQADAHRLWATAF